MKKILNNCVFSAAIIIMAVFPSVVQSETIMEGCQDIEYYDDMMYHSSNIEILGYYEGLEGPFDRMGNVDIQDVIRQDGKLYTADYNIHESKVCIERVFSINKKKLKNYDVYNPWEETWD